MKIDLEFVHLHTGLFLDGINFGEKLYSDPIKNLKGQLIMYYDTELKHTVVMHKDKVALIESTASKTLKDPTQVGIILNLQQSIKKVMTEPIHNPHVRAQVSGPGMGLKLSAQVETPIDKVQGKPGGRKPKYQGEESQGE